MNLSDEKRLYAITDRRALDRATFLKMVEEAILGGVGIVQLREEDSSTEHLLPLSRDILALCKRRGAMCIIDNNEIVAIKSGADGVHVGASDTPVAQIRAQNSKIIIGSTAKTVESALAAERDGANYLGVGAIFPSPTKPNAVRVTLETLDEICNAVKIPVFAIGGITAENLHLFKGIKIAGVAVCSEIFSAPDVRAASERLVGELNRL